MALARDKGRDPDYVFLSINVYFRTIFCNYGFKDY